MFWRKVFSEKVNLYKTCLSTQFVASKCVNSRSYTANLTCCHIKYVNKFKSSSSIPSNTQVYLGLQRKWYSNRLLDGVVTELQQNQLEKEYKRITELFPQPRVTLNELTTRTPDKIFEIHYKQNVSAPKGRKKQKLQVNDWTCTYAFVWPEKIKFEGTALSKRQAAEKAAIQALHYLHTNRRIDNRGFPIYNQDKIEELRNSIQEPMKINVSEASIERIGRIWEDYQNEIRDIYERTFKEAQYKVVLPPPVISKDSTIDEDDEFPENESKISDEVEDISELKVPVHPVYGRTISPPSEAALRRRDDILRKKFDRYDEELAPLPIDQYADQITSTLSSSRVAVIVGAPGCGKSTRAPLALLRHLLSSANIIVSEPRRVAATGLAERVAHEMNEQVGESVGYQIRLHAKPPRPPAGGILYCTSGVLLRRLQTNPGLVGCSHVFIDEAHERDVNTDLTLLLLKRALDTNKQLRVVVMSATLDTHVFTRYFSNCPVIEVPGRTFPVTVSYLEEIQRQFNIALPHTMDNCQKEGRPAVNCQEVAEVIKAIDRSSLEGSILVFLPGWAEIKQTKQYLESECSPSTHLILPVHSRLSSSDQHKIFSSPAPGIRKIVLATNIAETSITIPDVGAVVDSGTHKQNTVREGTGAASLETVWVSAAGARQRAGRAGRVRPGHCYRLYTKEKESDFPPHTTPEILRIPLEQTVLDCKTYAPEDKVENFLAQLPEPPTLQAVQFAVNDLIDIGALTPSEHLTRLGSILSSVSLAPRAALSLTHALLVGNVVSAAHVLTHCNESLHIFSNATERKEEIRAIKREYSETSDHAALHHIQEEFERLSREGREAVEQWCDRYGLRRDRLGAVTALSNLYLEQILKCGLVESTVDPAQLNRFSDVDELTAAILISGADALLRTKRHVKTKGKLRTVTELFTSTGERAHIGGESVNYSSRSRADNALFAYAGGYHSTERRALVVHMTSAVPPHAPLLTAKGDVHKQVQSEGDNENNAILSMPRHKLQVHMTCSQADHMLKAREMLHNTFQYYIERDLKSLDYDENTTISRFKVRLVKAIGRILTEGHREYVEKKSIEEYDVDR